MKKIVQTLSILAALGAVTLPSVAHADDKAECIAASEKAQQLRDDRKLLKSREQYLACSKDACPAAIKKDCADGVADIDKRTPSVVIRAKGKKGEDLVAVKVTNDGVVITEQLDGRAVLLDPGVHTFKFESEGNDPLEQKVVVAEGEQNRPVTAMFGKGVEGGGGGGVPEKKGAPIGAFVIGGIGIVSAAIAPIFYVMGLGEKSDIENGKQICTTATCDNEKGDIRAKLAVGDIFMGVGILGIGVGVVWTIVHYTSGPSNREGTSAASFDFAPTRGGGFGSATFRF